LLLPIGNENYKPEENRVYCWIFFFHHFKQVNFIILISRYLYEKEEDDTKIIISHHPQILLKDIYKKKPKTNLPSMEDLSEKTTPRKENKTSVENKEIQIFSTPITESISKNRRVFWMPDDVATSCYECRTPFSVFIRKHHCR
jgi:hypothetical protein